MCPSSATLKPTFLVALFLLTWPLAATAYPAGRGAYYLAPVKSPQRRGPHPTSALR